jgi:ureidoacrylate peracid hydrolase
MNMPVLIPYIEPVMLEAEPEPLEIDLQRTAVIVIDMQNTFVSKGGVLDLMGLDISPCVRVIKLIDKMNSAARTRGVKVIYVVHYYSPDLRETGGPNSGNWYTRHLVLYREHPEWRDKFFVRGTWGAEIVKELEPKEDEILVAKPRFSDFFGTDLDTILKTFSIKFLVFVGVDTSICVESGIRDASYLDYFPILISDAVASAGPPFTQEATIFNVKRCFGWVTTTERFVKALKK